MSAGWTPVYDTEKQFPGTRYRSEMLLRVPYALKPAIQAAMVAHVALNGDFTIKAWSDLPPGTPPLQQGVWLLAMEYEIAPKPEYVAAGIDPWAIAAIVGFVVAGFVVLGLLEQHFSRWAEVVGAEVEKVIHAAAEGAKDVLNPALLIAAVLVVFLVSHRS